MKPILRYLSLLLLISVAVTACKSPANKINRLTTGMTKAEVIRILGQPRTTAGQGNTENLHYRLTRYRPPLKVPLHEEYDVYLVDGLVAAFGKPNEIRKILPRATPEEQTVNVNVRSSNTSTNVNVSPPAP